LFLGLLSNPVLSLFGGGRGGEGEGERGGGKGRAEGRGERGRGEGERGGRRGEREDPKTVDWLASQKVIFLSFSKIAQNNRIINE
jgi:hypothetical protein